MHGCGSKMFVNPKRIRVLVRKEKAKGPVVYWMARDQRVCDNWALLHAKELAEKDGSPLAVVFCLVPKFLGATSRQYRFMLQGLKEVERNLRALDIAFFLLQGDPGREIPAFLSDQDASTLVCDFSPLRQSQIWKKVVTSKIELPFYEVDAHNIVPCWLASPKAEWAAYSFRPKIHRLLPEFMDEFPPLKRHRVPWKDDVRNDWRSAESRIEVDAVAEANFNCSGEVEAAKQSLDFIENKLSGYESNRNDPSKDGQSHLSPYLHFGQISAQRVALQVLASMKDAGAFLEELIVRRELSDNFCYYNPNYDSFWAFPKWARETLEKHAKDRREYIYTAEEFERARTHDDLWNAAQNEMVYKGKMHGYMRMYWAKKILEWTGSPVEAQQIAIYLNDRYELDGRDPNGYVGIAWSIGGVHDRAWKERAIFGKVRYMSYKGVSRKFDILAYINSIKNM